MICELIFLTMLHIAAPLTEVKVASNQFNTLIESIQETPIIIKIEQVKQRELLDSILAESSASTNVFKTLLANNTSVLDTTLNSILYQIASFQKVQNQMHASMHAFSDEVLRLCPIQKHHLKFLDWCHSNDRHPKELSKSSECSK